MIGANGGMVSNNLFAYCDNDPVNKADPSGQIAANIVGAVIGGIVGAVGGYFLTNWLADKIGLKGWKRKVFVWGLSAIITAAAATIGCFIGPYVAKLVVKLGNYVAKLIQKGKIALKKFSSSVLDVLGITKKIVNNLIKNVSKLKYTKTALSHLSSRPYMKSTQTICNIMKSSKPKIDSSLRYGLKWVVKGKWNGKSGTWELVVDVFKKRIVHFLFRS